MSGAALKLVDDLDRVLALPRRSVLDCERERGVRRWSPEAQALIEVVTAKYTKGPRLSCACRDRYVEATSSGGLVVFHKPPRPGAPPPPPLHTTVDAFCQDNRHDSDVVEIVSGLRTGQNTWLTGLGYPVCMTELNPVQAWGLWELPRAGGVFGMISVGGGKSFLGLLTPLTMPHIRTWAILIKPDQRFHYVKAYRRLREHFKTCSLIIDQASTRGFTVRDTPSLHVIPYSTLSNPKSTRLLELLDPDGVVADESHLIADATASRTLRFLRFMGRRNDIGRPVVFCNWSGSTIKRSIKDAWHLAAYSLGMGSPYPIDKDTVQRWADVVDPSNIPDRISPTAKKLRYAFGNKERVERAFLGTGFGEDDGVREGMRDRVIATLGVISTKSASINCSISIKEWKTSKIPDAVMAPLADLRRDGTLRVGAYEEEMADAAEISRATHTIAAGFYFYWAFPRATAEERAEGGLITEWFRKRKAWNKELRAKIRCGEAHLDSRMLCENAAKRAYQEPRYRGDLPVWPANNWTDWEQIRDKVYYDERTRWVDDFLVKDAAAWAKEHRGIVWCAAPAFGEAVADAAGIPYHGGGANAEAKILAEDGSRSIVASLKAHGEGRDGLQYKFHKQLIADIPPSSGNGYEQLLGRLAREGQPEDTVETWLPLHVTENLDAFRKAYALAQFIEATTPNRQLLLAADIEFDF